MNPPIPAYELGRVPYRDALGFMHRAVQARAEGSCGDAIYFVEHEPVLTVGRAGRSENLRASERELARLGVQIVPVERGGDVTYHGPGQVVGYPIVSLRDLPSGCDLHRYLRDLEEVVIRAVSSYGLSAGRRAPFTGVWVADRKVAAIGVAVRRWIAFHGFALNLDPDLDHFNWIHPCGIRHLGVASLRTLLGSAPSRADVLARLRAAFAEVWQRPVIEAPAGARADILWKETFHA